jgi:hypothetical protein
MGHDHLQIMGVPGGDPMLGQFPSVVSSHGVFSEFVTLNFSTSNILTAPVRLLRFIALAVHNGAIS